MREIISPNVQRISVEERSIDKIMTMLRTADKAESRLVSYADIELLAKKAEARMSQMFLGQSLRHGMKAEFYRASRGKCVTVVIVRGSAKWYMLNVNYSAYSEKTQKCKSMTLLPSTEVIKYINWILKCKFTTLSYEDGTRTQEFTDVGFRDDSVHPQGVL
jgi:hypothetical protein